MDLTVSMNPAVGGAIGPFKGSRAFVVTLDVTRNLAGEVSFRSEDAPGDQVALDFGEPDFDLIEPRRISRGIMKLDVRVDREELIDSLRLVGGKVVDDHVDFLATGLGGDHVRQKGHELGTGVARGRFAQNLPAGNFQRCVKRESPVAEILEPVPFGATRRQRKNRIESVERLNGCLLVHAKDRRMSRGLKIQPNDIRSLGFEIRIVADHVVTPPRRLQAGLRPDTGDSHVTDVEFGGQFARTPVGGAVARLAVQGPVDDPRLEMFGAGCHSFTRMTTPQTGESSFKKAIPPQLDGVHAAGLSAADCSHGLRPGQAKDNPRPPNIVRTATLAAAHSLQLTPFRRTQSERCWHEKHHAATPSYINVTLH